MNHDEFRRHGYALVDWIATYLAQNDDLPVLPRVAPGDVRRSLPPTAPEEGESFDAIVADFHRLLAPALTHWNHPAFFAYFPSSASPAAVLAEFVAAAINQQAMLWRTSPAATELESVSLSWLRQLLGLPEAFEGVIYDTASISTLHGLAAAREASVTDVRQHGLPARADVPRLRVYCSEHAHSSVDKAAILLGLGHDAVRRVPVDADFAMDATALRQIIDADRASGCQAIAVVATIGTTSTTSVDPVAAIADVCTDRGIWLHVDAAYAGAAAMLPDYRAHFAGWDRADSVVVNPHKWMFVPVDLSAFYSRRMDCVRRAFALVPEYLRTPAAERGEGNLMDTGIQLGRRFRALKLWMTLRHLGARGVRDVLTRHLDLARQFAGWIDAHPDFERLAPVPFSVVCFRACPPRVAAGDLDLFNQRLLDAVNGSGEAFLSHTQLNSTYVLRMAIGQFRTEQAHVERVWALLQARTAAL